MKHLRVDQAQSHEFYDGTVKVNEFNFIGEGGSILNDADIVLTGRYPEAGYAVNDLSTALISVESGEGDLTIKNKESRHLTAGDRILLAPGEPYFFSVIGQLTIRYIATPAWTLEQSRIIE